MVMVFFQKQTTKTLLSREGTKYLTGRRFYMESGNKYSGLGLHRLMN